jgi:uncharacterized membrane protein YdjX (TVP38/TMEM64 family)
LPLYKKTHNVTAMPQKSDRTKRLFRYLLMLLIPALLSAAVVFSLWQSHPEIAYWQQLLLDGRAYLEGHPWALVLVVATLPGLGLPISPLLILMGIVLGPLYGLPATCAIAIAAQGICSIWAYGLAAGPFRELLKRTLLKKWTLPELSERGALRIGLIIRITPGIPYALQNVALGVMGLRFKTYLLASIPTQALYAIGFVVTGGAIFEGRGGLALTGVLLLVVVILITRTMRNRTKINVG